MQYSTGTPVAAWTNSALPSNATPYTHISQSHSDNTSNADRSSVTLQEVRPSTHATSVDAVDQGPSIFEPTCDASVATAVRRIVTGARAGNLVAREIVNLLMAGDANGRYVKIETTAGPVCVAISDILSLEDRALISSPVIDLAVRLHEESQKGPAILPSVLWIPVNVAWSIATAAVATSTFTSTSGCDWLRENLTPDITKVVTALHVANIHYIAVEFDLQPGKQTVRTYNSISGLGDDDVVGLARSITSAIQLACPREGSSPYTPVEHHTWHQQLSGSNDCGLYAIWAVLLVRMGREMVTFSAPTPVPNSLTRLTILKNISSRVPATVPTEADVSTTLSRCIALETRLCENEQEANQNGEVLEDEQTIINILPPLLDIRSAIANPKAPFSTVQPLDPDVMLGRIFCNSRWSTNGRSYVSLVKSILARYPTAMYIWGIALALSEEPEVQARRTSTNLASARSVLRHALGRCRDLCTHNTAIGLFLSNASNAIIPEIPVQVARYTEQQLQPRGLYDDRFPAGFVSLQLPLAEERTLYIVLTRSTSDASPTICPGPHLWRAFASKFLPSSSYAQQHVTRIQIGEETSSPFWSALLQKNALLAISHVANKPSWKPWLNSGRFYSSDHLTTEDLIATLASFGRLKVHVITQSLDSITTNIPSLLAVGGIPNTTFFFHVAIDQKSISLTGMTPTAPDTWLQCTIQDADREWNRIYDV